MAARAIFICNSILGGTMDFENVFETIHFELVLEGIGAIFGFGLLWQFLFQQGLHNLLALFIATIC